MFLKSKFLGVALATCVAVGVSACGADESKAPELSLNGGLGMFVVESKDDDTVIKGVTVIGRNGKCPKHTVTSRFNTYKDMEECDSLTGCKPIFDGNKLAYGERKLVYSLDNEDNCPPKNGAYKVELDTNFGTYVYEIKSQY